MSRNSAVPTLTPTFLAVTPPRRMYPGYPLPRYELPKNTPRNIAGKPAMTISMALRKTWP